MSDELKPCPYCQSWAIRAQDEVRREMDLDWMDSEKLVSCGNENCHAHHQWFFEHEWQTRPIEDDLRAKLALAVEALEWVEGFTENSYDPNVGPIWEAAREALAKIRS